MIKVCDLNGHPGGRTSTGEVEIRLIDINDNIPTLEKETVGLPPLPHPAHLFLCKVFLVFCFHSGQQ